MLRQVGIALSVLAVATAIFLVLSPSKPDISHYQSVQPPSASYSAGGSGCEQTDLNKLRGLQRTAKESACASARDSHEVEQDNLAQAARNARAAEQAALMAYAQAQTSAAQSSLLFLAFAAAVWGALAAAKAAKAAEAVITDLERPWLHFFGAEIERRDQMEIRAGKGPILNAYYVTPVFKNAGRMLAIIDCVEFRFIEKNKAPEIPDYSNLLPLGSSRFVQPGKKTPLKALGAPTVGPPLGVAVADDYVFYGRVYYDGLISKGHVTGFGITIGAVIPAHTTYGGDKYNYHT